MITAIIPAYRTPEMCAYTVAKLLEFGKPGELDIIIVNNYPADRETLRHLQPFIDKTRYYDYPVNRIQSHGLAFDWCLENGYVNTEYFLTLESDCYPVKEFIPYYQNIIEQRFDAAGSMLKLSGGLYMHPCGGLYKKSVWEECRDYCRTIEYSYFPNMIRTQGFDFHAMIHNSVLDKVLESPEDYFDLANGYKPYTKELASKRKEHYSPTINPFHNGMGNLNESIETYGGRGFETDVPHIILSNKNKIVKRVGYEPGQFLSYWLFAMNKNIFQIPIEVKWMNDREGQQQEYTINEAGLHHCWGISSYTERPAEGVEDIYKEKRELPKKLYHTLPENLKVKI